MFILPYRSINLHTRSPPFASKQAMGPLEVHKLRVYWFARELLWTSGFGKYTKLVLYMYDGNLSTGKAHDITIRNQLYCKLIATKRLHSCNQFSSVKLPNLLRSLSIYFSTYCILVFTTFPAYPIQNLQKCAYRKFHQPKPPIPLSPWLSPTL